MTESLTPREIEVLRLLAGGCTYARVADRLGISVHTVTSHIKNTYRKLDVHCAAQAVYRALELCLLEIPSKEGQALGRLSMTRFALPTERSIVPSRTSVVMPI